MIKNGIYNKTLDAYNVPKDVYNAIKKASAATGVNFTYLVEKAAVESGFDKNAKAGTSSATGLYQFIESTWLTMVKEHGDKYGLAKYADKIGDDNKVSDPKARREILNLRKDPEVASLMAAEFDSSNYQQLKDNVGGKIGATELYMAHFLGAGGASGFLNAMNKSPNMAAADVFPREARANRNVFYDQQTGQPRSLKQVYAFFDNKFDSASGNINIASNAGEQQATAQKAASAYAGEQRNAPRAIALEQDSDTFARLASLMGNDQKSPSVLRIDGSNEAENWKIFPPALYSKLSLSPAQMMLLSDFNA